MNHKPEQIAPTGALLGHPSMRRDTADACRDKAKDNLLLAVKLPGGTQRDLLERSAAAWSMRAEQLQRQEARLAGETPNGDPATDHVRV